MTSPDVPFGVWCWPGRQAGAGVQQLPSGEQVLGIFLDPVNLVLTIAPFPDGPMRTAQFLRELARAASQMATELDSATSARRSGGAHRVLPDDPAESGAATW
jgi:hypothetical protein